MQGSGCAGSHPALCSVPKTSHPSLCCHQDSLRLPPHLLPCHTALGLLSVSSEPHPDILDMPGLHVAFPSSPQIKS